MQLNPDGVWNVPLRVPVIFSPPVATLPVADATSAAPRPISAVNGKLAKVTAWPATVPETVPDGAPGAWARRFTWTAEPVCVTVAKKPRIGNGKFAAQVDAAVIVVLYSPAMFAGGAVGAVGLLSPHAVNDPIAAAVASHFFIEPESKLCIWTS